MLNAILIILFVFLILCFQTDCDLIKKVDMSATAKLEIKLTKILIEIDKSLKTSDIFCTSGQCQFYVAIQVCTIHTSENILKILLKIKEQLRSDIDLSFQECMNPKFIKSMELMINPELICAVKLEFYLKNANYVEEFKNMTIELNTDSWMDEVLLLVIVSEFELDCLTNLLVASFGMLSLKSERGLLQNITVSTIRSDAENEVNIINEKRLILVNFIDDNSSSPITSTVFLTAKVNCKDDYYRSGCWYYCKSVENQYKCDPETGLQDCYRDWISYPVIYQDNERPLINIKIFECLIYNACTDYVCKPPNSYCIAVGNNSKYCSDGTLIFDPDYLVLSPSETVTCSFDFGEDSENPYSHMLRTEWQIDLRQPNYITNNVLIDFIFKNDKVTVFENVEGSYSNLLQCSLYDLTNVLKFTVYRNYTVIGKPHFIYLNVTLQHVILGDNIKCFTDAFPISYFVQEFRILTNNFFIRTDKQDIIHVPVTAILGEMVLRCSFSYINTNGTSMKYFRDFRVYIHAFDTFKWTERLRWYDKNETVSLVVNANVYYLVDIIETQGPTALYFPREIDNSSLYNFMKSPYPNTKSIIQLKIYEKTMIYKNVINLSFSSFMLGGLYQFYAILRIPVQDQYLVFYKSVEARLFQIPTYIEMNYIIGYPGERIYCETNGYPKSLITITITLNSTNLPKYFSRTITSNRVIIPFDIPLGVTYDIYCSYVMTDFKNNFTDFIVKTVKIKTRQKPFNYAFLKSEGLINWIFIVFLFIIIWIFIFLFVGPLINCGIHHPTNNLLKIKEKMKSQKFLDYTGPICYSHMRNTFLNYNRHRKVTRYNIKMNDLADSIIFMSHSGPIQRDMFLQYLKFIERDSYSKGYGIRPEILKPSKSEEDLKLINRIGSDRNSNESLSPDLVSKLSKIKSFYGIGPPAINK